MKILLLIFAFTTNMAIAESCKAIQKSYDVCGSAYDESLGSNDFEAVESLKDKIVLLDLSFSISDIDSMAVNRKCITQNKAMTIFCLNKKGSGVGESLTQNFVEDLF